jgi:hypothetical protein
MPAFRIFILVLFISLLRPVGAELLEVKNKKVCALSKKLSASEITEHAALIFKGKFLETVDINDASPIKRVALKFSVSESLKGLSAAQQEITVYQWASLENHFDNLDKDREYIFHFYAPSPNSGLSSLVGGRQGIIPATASI